MLRSMTAFGRIVETTAIGSLTVEIQSVNRKHLDVKVHCPPELRRFEMDMQNLISGSVFRGQVTVRIIPAYEKQSPISVSPNRELAVQIKKSADKIAQELEINHPDFLIRLLAGSKDILNYTEEIADEQAWKLALISAVSAALKPFMKMKVYEGGKLFEDFTRRIDRLSCLNQEIDQLSDRSVEMMRKKLTEMLETAFQGRVENEETLLREVCLYAEKVDISEEITRFNAHLEHFKEIMESRGAVGKTLEFIGQELFRETNTIASKVNDIEISRKTIEMKTELERIREQLQNVE